MRMIALKRMPLFALLLMAASIVAACGGSGNGDGGNGGNGSADGADSPEAAVRNVVEQTYSISLQAANAYICDENKLSDNTIATREAQSPEDSEFDGSGLEYSIAEESGNMAMVSIGGQMTITNNDQTQEVPASTLFQDNIRTEEIDGRWYVCDPSMAQGTGSN